MEAKKWKTKIKKACEGAGTYQPYFDGAIDSLAAILAKRDEAQEMYIERGSVPVVEHIGKGGETNLVKNPILVMWSDLNTQALQYWRDLGLTPAGLRKIDESAVKQKKSSKLVEVLANLEKEIK